MAKYKDVVITEAGSALIQRQIIAGTEPLNFSAIAIGDGEISEGVTMETMTSLVNEKKRIPVETFTRVGNSLWITGRLSTDSISEGIYHREVGVYVGDTLFAYGNTGDDYDFIPPAGENTAVSKTIKMKFAIGAAKVYFEELDTSDLVTHDALESRMQTIVEPYAKKLTEETVNEAFDGAVGEQVRLIVNDRVNSELLAAGEYRTTAGSDNFNAHAFDIFEPPIGEMQQIAIPCRSNNSGSNMYTASSVYLAIFERTEAGEWVHVGTSTNAITQTIGTTAYFTFDGLKLTGRRIRIVLKTDRNDIELTAQHVIGARVTAAPEKGIAITNAAMTASQEYIIDATFTGSNVAEKYAPLSHVSDTAIHVTAEERERWNAGGGASPEMELYFQRAQADVVSNGFITYDFYLGFIFPVVDVGKLSTIEVRAGSDVKADTALYCHVWFRSDFGVYSYVATSLAAVQQVEYEDSTWHFDGTQQLVAEGQYIFLFTTSAEPGADLSAYVGAEKLLSAMIYNETSASSFTGYISEITGTKISLTAEEKSGLPQHRLGVIAPFENHVSSDIHITSGERSAWNSKADRMDAKERYLACEWRDGDDGMVYSNTLYVSAGASKTAKLVSKTALGVTSTFSICKVETLSPLDSTDITYEVAASTGALTLNITAASGASGNYLLRFTVVVLSNGTSPQLITTLLHVRV